MKKFLFLLVIFACSFMITSKKVYATEVIKSVYSEPQYSETSGYIDFLVTNGTEYWTITWAWNGIQYDYAEGTSEQILNPFRVEVWFYNNQVYLDFLQDEGIGTVYINHSRFWNNRYGNDINPVEYGSFMLGSSNKTTLVYTTFDGYQIVGFTYKGNVTNITNYLSSKQNYTITWGSQSIGLNKLDSIIDILTGIRYNDSVYHAELKQLLNQIYTSNLYIDEQLEVIYSFIQTWIPDLYSQLVDVEFKLDKVIETLEKFIGDSEAGTGEEVDDSSTQTQKDKENALLNKGNATTNTSQVNLQLDTTANASIWNIVDRFININPLVFGLFISILSLGVVKLILAR